MQLEQVEPRTSSQSCPQAGTIRVHTSNAHEVAAVDLRLSHQHTGRHSKQLTRKCAWPSNELFEQSLHAHAHMRQ